MGGLPITRATLRAMSVSVILLQQGLGCHLWLYWCPRAVQLQRPRGSEWPAVPPGALSCT